MTLSAVLLAALPAQAPAQTTTPVPAQAAMRPKSPLVAMYLAPMVFQKVGGFFGEVIDVGWNKLKGTLPATATPPAPADPSAAQLAQYNMPANPAGMMNAVFIPPPPPIPTNATTATGVMYAIDRINPDNSVRETITPQAGVSPSFESRERFAIRYTSNLPGVVLIMNVDALHKTAYLGTFVVRPGAEMRFPEAANRGMALDDNVGLETYQMFFMACLPPGLAAQPDAAAIKGLVPDCGSQAQAEQSIVLANKGRRTKGTYNEALQQADGASKVVLSMAPYEKGDVTVTTFTFNHVAPGSSAPQALPAPPAQPAPPPQPEPGVTGRV